MPIARPGNPADAPDAAPAPTPPMPHARRLVPQRPSALLGAALALGLAVAAPQPAQALTIVLNFVPATTTDIYNVTTTAEAFTTWGFTSLTLASIRTQTLAAVRNDYLAYPTSNINPLSPLPAGRQLNIDFTFSNGLTPPGNGDSEYFYVDIGDANPNQSFLGQACLGCVRSATGVATQPVGSIVGSILTDSIFSLVNLATSDAQRINLLAGTVAHEIGHTLTLVHPASALANPGQSSYSLMGTGAAPTSMPNAERVKDRAFAYTEFATLISTVGLVSAVPEPATSVLLAAGVLALAWRRPRAAAGRAMPAIAR